MIYIMAQGEGSRWQGASLPCDYKQMLPINGVPIIFRTLEMLWSREFELIKVIAFDNTFANSQFLIHQARKIKRLQFESLRYPGSGILMGISQLLHQEEKRLQGLINPIRILLGDVIFSHDALDQILACDDYTIFGRKGPNPVTGKEAGEIFAVVVPTHVFPHFLKQITDFREAYTKLWQIYKSSLYLGDFVEINDYTDDVDSPEAYAQFWEKLEQAAIEDDKAHKV